MIRFVPPGSGSWFRDFFLPISDAGSRGLKGTGSATLPASGFRGISTRSAKLDNKKLLLCRLRHIPRNSFKVCVLGDQQHCDEAKEKGTKNKHSDQKISSSIRYFFGVWFLSEKLHMSSLPTHFCAIDFYLFPDNLENLWQFFDLDKLIPDPNPDILPGPDLDEGFCYQDITFLSKNRRICL
jgi:hypothetical protein